MFSIMNTYKYTDVYRFLVIARPFCVYQLLLSFYDFGKCSVFIDTDKLYTYRYINYSVKRNVHFPILHCHVIHKNEYCNVSVRAVPYNFR